MKLKFSVTMGIITISIALLTGCVSQGIPFNADIGRQKSPVPGMTDIRIPYTDVLNYFGYIKPGSEPDAIVNGKKMYYLYVWIPLVAPEIGTRMFSPVPKGFKPSDKDFVATDFPESQKDPTSFFDTWITFERAETILMPDDILKNGATTNWISYGANDDSGELPAQPSGNKYNSQLRVTSDINDPLKAIVRGVYRIGFTTYKVGEVKGSFLAQVGAPIKLPGVVIAKTLEDLRRLIK